MLCACGCGEPTESETRKFVRGHWNRPCRSPEEYAKWKPERDAKRAQMGRDCAKRYQAKVRAEQGPVEARRRSLWTRYRLTPEAYEALLEEQDGACAICGTKEPRASGRDTFCVDHVHESGPYKGSRTGAIRGLLCGRCNMAIGLLDHNPEALEAAIGYLEAEPAMRR